MLQFFNAVCCYPHPLKPCSRAFYKCMVLDGTRHSLSEAFTGWQRTWFTTGTAAVLWIGFTLLYYPQYSYQLLTADVTYLTEAVTTLVWYQHATNGVIGVVLPLLITVLTAALLTLTVTSLRQQYTRKGSLSGAAGGVLGFLSAGCASCGVGVLAVLGVGSGLAFLPFQGVGVQVVSVLVLLAALEYTGRQPAVCTA